MIKPTVKRQSNRGSAFCEFLFAMMFASILAFGTVEVMSSAAVSALRMSGVTRSELRPLHACVDLAIAVRLLERAPYVRAVERGYQVTFHPDFPRGGRIKLAASNPRIDLIRTRDVLRIRRQRRTSCNTSARARRV